MSLEILEERVAHAVSSATNYADKCKELIAAGDLSSALIYCQKLGIEPPKCSLTAKTENAHKLRTSTSRKLSDPKWWGNALETWAVRSYEREQSVQGNIKNYISNGLAAYMAKQKGK